MHRGFSKVVEKLPAIADKDIGFILKNTGMVLLSTSVGPAVRCSAPFSARRAGDPGHQSLTLLSCIR
jgi:dihydroxyacetone kinase-like protein